MSAVFERGLGGKRIMIVGSASGIGAATAKRLALEGAKVICADINIDGAEQVAQAIQAQDGLAEPMLIDIANANSISHAIEKAEAMWHGLDGAHLNAADLRVIFQDTDAEQLASEHPRISLPPSRFFFQMMQPGSTAKCCTLTAGH
jgi:NAD(P)-dependent dehydrogenase (short-subunit alcohol dehydrogenase family)